MTTAARTVRMLAHSGRTLGAPLSSSFSPLQEAVPRTLDPSCAVRSVNTDGGAGAASIKEDEPHFRTVNVTSSGEGMACRHQAVKHELTTDEPVRAGGTDKGPDPLSTLLASLTGCTQYTAHSVAKEKDIPLEGIDFDVAGTFDVRGYLGVGDAPPYLQKVKLHAHVKTSADEAAVEELSKEVLRRNLVAGLFRKAGIDMDYKFSKAS